MPKPNYSPLRIKSLERNKSTFEVKKKNPYDLQLSLPPIKSSKKHPMEIRPLNKSLEKRKESLPKIVSARYRGNKHKIY